MFVFSLWCVVSGFDCISVYRAKIKSHVCSPNIVKKIRALFLNLGQLSQLRVNGGDAVVLGVGVAQRLMTLERVSAIVGRRGMKAYNRCIKAVQCI